MRLRTTFYCLAATLVLRSIGIATLAPYKNPAAQYERNPDDNSAHYERNPHAVDCKPLGIDGTTDKGMFVTTKTKTPFLMNIHDPQEDTKVSKDIYEKGCFECGHIEGMLEALEKYENSYFLDVGGNIGMWTLSAAAAGKQTFTIEPSKENYNRICKTINKNSFHELTQILTIAATKKPCTVVLNPMKGNKGGTSISVTNEDSAEGSKDIIEGYPIDSLGLPLDRPVVVKVDVEGHELRALLGAKSFLQSANIVHMSIELRASSLARQCEQWKEISQVLVSKGLEPTRINYSDETKLDATDICNWRHFKHPHVLYFDVVWRMKEN